MLRMKRAAAAKKRQALKKHAGVAGAAVKYDDYEYARRLTAGELKVSFFDNINAAVEKFLQLDETEYVTRRKLNNAIILALTAYKTLPYRLLHDSVFESMASRPEHVALSLGRLLRDNADAISASKEFMASREHSFGVNAQNEVPWGYDKQDYERRVAMFNNNTDFVNNPTSYINYNTYDWMVPYGTRVKVVLRDGKPVSARLLRQRVKYEAGEYVYVVAPDNMRVPETRQMYIRCVLYVVGGGNWYVALQDWWDQQCDTLKHDRDFVVKNLDKDVERLIQEAACITGKQAADISDDVLSIVAMNKADYGSYLEDQTENARRLALKIRWPTNSALPMPSSYNEAVATLAKHTGDTAADIRASIDAELKLINKTAMS